jgi:hypothetical protein
MQVEERKACPSCGTENPRTVDFCWKCYTAFVAPAPARPAISLRPGIRMPLPPPMASPSGLPGSAKPTGVPFVARIAVGVIAALLGMYGVRFLFDRGPSLPDELAGQPRLTTQAIADFEGQMAEQGEAYDLDVAAAAYGTGATPAFLVMLVEGRAIETTDELFDSLVQGMAQGGAIVNESATDRGERDGTEYRCVPFTGAAAAAAACMWRDDGTVGIVLDLSAGIDETRELLFTVHDTVT